MNPISESESPQQVGGRKLTIVLFTLGLIGVVIAFIIGISDNPPGILLLLIGSFTLLVAFLQFLGKVQKRKPMHTLLYWAPRALCIVFAVFIILPALESIGKAEGLGETSFAILMGLLPTFIVIGVLVVSWHREWIGGILFIVLGLLLVVFARDKFLEFTYALIVSGPLLVIGILFLLNWRYGEKLRDNSHA